MPGFSGTTDNPKALLPSDVVNDLTSTDIDKPLSAAQGKELNEAIQQATATQHITSLPNGLTAYKSGNVVTLSHNSSAGIPQAGITLPNSLKPINGSIVFTGKANKNGTDVWDQGFVIDNYGILTARSVDNNSSIAVTWTNWTVTYITAE